MELPAPAGTVFTVKHSVAVNNCRRTVTVPDRETGTLNVDNLDKLGGHATDDLTHLHQRFGGEVRFLTNTWPADLPRPYV